MNICSFLPFTLLFSLAPAVVAQTWQRPTPEQGCPVEALQRIKLIADARAGGQSIVAGSDLDRKVNGMGAARVFSARGEPVKCIGDVCPIVIVNIVPPTEGRACVASIEENTDLRVPDNLKSVVIEWSLDPKGTCATAKASCKFDQSDGIYVIKNGSMQWSVWNYTDTMFQMFDRNESGYRRAQLDYEPHVFWRDAGGRYQSCCPIDPRIIND